MENFNETRKSESDNVVLQLAELLSNQHPDVIKEVSACTEDTKEYYMGNSGSKTDLKNGVEDLEFTAEDCSCIQWIVMVKCLLEHGIAIELDWKCELNDFYCCTGQIAGNHSNHLPFCMEWFDEEDSVWEWCGILNAKWAENQCAGKDACLVQLDMESDSYVLLVISPEQFKLAQKYAREAGQNLYLAGSGKSVDAPHTLNAFMKKWRMDFFLQSCEFRVSMDCEKCFSSDTIPAVQRPCYLLERCDYTVVLKVKELLVRQIVAIGKSFRMGAMEIKRRLDAGREIYVKNRLYDTLILMELLEGQKIAYEVLPEAPNFPHFKECPKRVAASAGNDWLYHQFDREREGLI